MINATLVHRPIRGYSTLFGKVASDAIAEEAGCSKGVVYPQLARKADVFMALLDGGSPSARRFIPLARTAWPGDRGRPRQERQERW